ncbi:MAG: hypothetical protein AAFX03_00545 [Pseudomonadota bacterium]
MAKALFHKNQRVFVKPVGTWALIERVIPHWVKDVEEPLRITYDLGLGREFSAGELVSEAVMNGRNQLSEDEELVVEDWRIFRMRNRWMESENTNAHPYPGTFPVVVTGETDWGGWRVPGAEYDRDPHLIEHQARMIVNTPDMVKVCKSLAQFVADHPEDAPAELVSVAKRAAVVLRHIYDAPAATQQAAE